MVFVKIQSRSGTVLAEKLDIDGDTVLDLKKSFQKQCIYIYIYFIFIVYLYIKVQQIYNQLLLKLLKKNYL